MNEELIINEILFSKIKKCVIKTSPVELNIDKISLSSKLVDDLNFDSLSMVKLIIELEDTLELEFDDDILDLDEFYSIISIIKVINQIDNMKERVEIEKNAG